VLAGLYFVATKVLLGFYKEYMLTQLRAVLTQAQLLSCVLRVLAGVVNALAGLFTYESDQFALVAFFRHNPSSLPDVPLFVNRLLRAGFFYPIAANDRASSSAIVV
jgi:hypothetical protein